MASVVPSLYKDRASFFGSLLCRWIEPVVLCNGLRVDVQSAERFLCFLSQNMGRALYRAYIYIGLTCWCFGGRQAVCNFPDMRRPKAPKKYAEGTRPHQRITVSWNKERGSFVCSACHNSFFVCATCSFATYYDNMLDLEEKMYPRCIGCFVARRIFATRVTSHHS